MHYELIEYCSFNQVFETAYEITNNVNKRQKPKTFFLNNSYLQNKMTASLIAYTLYI